MLSASVRTAACRVGDAWSLCTRLPATLAAMLNGIITLIRNPRPAGVQKLAGSRSDWRIRIGEYRIVYEIDDNAKTVLVLQVRSRRDAYR
jgi:mRNA interferase RelE/StbE